MNQLATLTATHTPALIAAAGDRASYRFLELFAGQIRNPNSTPGLPIAARNRNVADAQSRAVSDAH